MKSTLMLASVGRPCARRLLAWTLAACAALAALAPAVAADADAPALHPIETAASSAYWEGDFADLERQYAALRGGPAFLKDGRSTLALFRSGLTRTNETDVKRPEPYLRELEALTLQWAAAHPASSLAHVMHVNVLTAHAWSYRGDGLGSSVTAEAEKQFEAYLRSAVRYLDAHADVAMLDSSAHVALLRIGRGLGWGGKQLQGIAEAGLKRDPRDVSLYLDALIGMLPKWGGDARTVDRFIRSAAERTQADFGTGMYARMYSLAAQEQFSHGMFKNSLADWPTIKRAYADLQARYPDNLEDRNRYAYMACMARDKPTLLALLGELGTKVDADEWGENAERTLEGCQRWSRET